MDQSFKTRTVRLISSWNWNWFCYIICTSEVYDKWCGLSDFNPRKVLVCIRTLSSAYCTCGIKGSVGSKKAQLVKYAWQPEFDPGSPSAGRTKSCCKLSSDSSIHIHIHTKRIKYDNTEVLHKHTNVCVYCSMWLLLVVGFNMYMFYLSSSWNILDICYRCIWFLHQA